MHSVGVNTEEALPGKMTAAAIRLRSADIRRTMTAVGQMIAVGFRPAEESPNTYRQHAA